MPGIRNDVWPFLHVQNHTGNLVGHAFFGGGEGGAEEFFNVVDAVDDGVAMGVELFGDSLDAAAVFEVAFQGFDVVGAVAAVVIQDWLQESGAEFQEELVVRDGGKQAVETHAVEIDQALFGAHSHVQGGLGAFIAGVEVGDILDDAADTDVKVLVREFALDAADETVDDFLNLFLRQGIDDNGEAGIVIEEAAVVGDVLHVDMHLVAETTALDSVHNIQVSGGDEGNLEGTVHIKIGQQVPAVEVGGFRLLDGMDQGGRNLLIRGGLKEDVDTQFLDHVQKGGTPGNSHERKIIFITITNQGFWYLQYIFAGVDDQTGGVLLYQHPGQIQKFFLSGETKACGDCQLLAFEVVDNGIVLHQQDPVDGIGPAFVACQPAHLIFVFGYDQHILYRKSHNIPLFLISDS